MDVHENAIKEAFAAGWLAARSKSKDGAMAAFNEWRKLLIKPHGCRCSYCNHKWSTKEYPSPCPKCGKVWR